MRILIVEDETAAYENLADMLVTIDPTIEIMGNTESVRQTVRWLQANPRPDLIFMDIHLSDGSAFAIFDQGGGTDHLYYGVRSICDRRFQSKQHRLYLEAD